ncbi:hemerythrin domain-containing protein [Solimonas sp. SE-A11]|uniref:hemerythrin domain-containing protein n=1 Tax=Solimonas sp. SE-A11 TaxID=3054954 RepID=UPI00259D0098|nr:hemerythrin domain-containing protein [Solimonas sp. SE-A11]MDM4772525.1 hemerythrin domain-containing protein [Solimonas sp. SE-A11]
MDTLAPRYNIYSVIHKGLRAWMADTLQTLGRADWLDAEDSGTALGELRALLAVCRTHLAHENDFIHPAMEARRPGSSGQTGADHGEHIHAVDTLLARADALEATRGPRRLELGHALYLALAMFVAENHEHMDIEEVRNNAALWSAYSDAEIHAIEQALVATIPPPEMMLTLRWMLPSASHGERCGMLMGMRAGAPAEVFAGVLGMLQPLLSARDWARLQDALTQPVAMAKAA